MTEMKIGGRISQVLGKATSDIVVLLRQEVVRGVGKSLGALSAAIYLVVFFASIALLGFLATFMPLYWAALILAGIWAFISALWELPWYRLQKPLACPAKSLKTLGGVLNPVSFSRQFPKSQKSPVVLNRELGSVVQIEDAPCGF
jgi:hypothetical protein